MEPIISSEWIYWLTRADVIICVCIILAIIFGITVIAMIAAIYDDFCDPSRKSLHAYIRKDLIETVDVETEATDTERETYMVKLSNGQTFHNVMDTSTELFEFLKGEKNEIS